MVAPSPRRRAFYTLSVAKLRVVADPFRYDPWCVGPLTRLGVARAIGRQKRFCARGAEPMQTPCWDMKGSKRAQRRWHIERVAWLVTHGWKDPIEIDVGVPVLGFCPDWIVTDGNHRLAAAIYQGAETILASCGGQVDVFEEYVA